VDIRKARGALPLVDQQAQRGEWQDYLASVTLGSVDDFARLQPTKKLRAYPSLTGPRYSNPK